MPAPHDDGGPADPVAPPADTAPIDPSTLDLKEILSRYSQLVYRWVRAYGVASGDIEDLVQDVFFIVWRKLPQAEITNLPGWLYGITRNVVWKHRRKAWVRRVLLGQKEASSMDTTEAPGPGPLELVERKEASALLTSALAKMTPKRRAVFVLFELEGHSGEEIAAWEGVALNTIWTRLHHARRDLDKHLDELDPERGKGR